RAGTPASVATSGVMTCANGRAHAAARAIASTSREDIFPFLPQWTSPAELIYTADGHIKRRDGLTGPATVVPFSATLKLRRPVYPRRHRTLQPAGRQRALGIVDPAVSPDGSKVAFGALGDLWLLDASRSGAEPIQLTNDAYVELDPAWSPDGAKLVFSSDRGGNMD